MTALAIQGDARRLPLPDASVDLIVTSPPYFGLRSYTDGGEHYDGQIGSEATPAEFLAALWDCTREWMRVLKPTGSLFVNLGDSYAGSGKGGNTSLANSERYLGKRAEGYHPCTTTAPTSATDSATRGKRARRQVERTTRAPDYPNEPRPKSLMGLPWRYAIGCIDQLGLILRAEIVWSKPSGLPDPVTDRVRRSHEQWFHLVQQPRYFTAVDEIREPHAPASIARSRGNRFAPDLSQSGIGSPNTLLPSQTCNPLGKLPGSVWTIPTEPLTLPAHLGVDHFAAFPSEWPRRIILGWSPSGICVECGEGRRPVRDVVLVGGKPFAGRDYRRLANGPTGGTERPLPGGTNHVTITGYACACPTPDAPTRPSVILDPFGGTGTTAAVAHALGRVGISVDLSHDYSRVGRWRATDPGLRAKVLGVDKPAPVADDQLAFAEMTA